MEAQRRVRHPQDVIDRIMAMRNDYSASQIAEALSRDGYGIAKNSVISVWHRLGERRKPSTPVTATVVAARLQQVRQPRREKPAPKLPVTEKVTLEPVIVCDPVGILQIANRGQCKMIVGRGDNGLALMCGAPCDDKSAWCSHHRSMVYVRAA